MLTSNYLSVCKWEVVKMKLIFRVLIIAVAMLIVTAAWADKPIFQRVMDYFGVVKRIGCF